MSPPCWPLAGPCGLLKRPPGGTPLPCGLYPPCKYAPCQSCTVSPMKVAARHSYFLQPHLLCREHHIAGTVHTRSSR